MKKFLGSLYLIKKIVNNYLIYDFSFILFHFDTCGEEASLILLVSDSTFAGD